MVEMNFEIKTNKDHHIQFSNLPGKPVFLTMNPPPKDSEDRMTASDRAKFVLRHVFSSAEDRIWQQYRDQIEDYFEEESSSGQGPDHDTFTSVISDNPKSTQRLDNVHRTRKVVLQKEFRDRICPLLMDRCEKFAKWLVETQEQIVDGRREQKEKAVEEKQMSKREQIDISRRKLEKTVSEDFFDGNQYLSRDHEHVRLILSNPMYFRKLLEASMIQALNENCRQFPKKANIDGYDFKVSQELFSQNDTRSNLSAGNEGSEQKENAHGGVYLVGRRSLLAEAAEAARKEIFTEFLPQRDGDSEESETLEEFDFGEQTDSQFGSIPSVFSSLRETNAADTVSASRAVAAPGCSANIPSRRRVRRLKSKTKTKKNRFDVRLGSFLTYWIWRVREFCAFSILGIAPFPIFFNLQVPRFRKFDQFAILKALSSCLFCGILCGSLGIFYAISPQVESPPSNFEHTVEGQTEARRTIKVGLLTNNTVLPRMRMSTPDGTTPEMPRIMLDKTKSSFPKCISVYSISVTLCLVVAAGFCLGFYRTLGDGTHPQESARKITSLQNNVARRACCLCAIVSFLGLFGALMFSVALREERMEQWVKMMKDRGKELVQLLDDPQLYEEVVRSKTSHLHPVWIAFDREFFDNLESQSKNSNSSSKMDELKNFLDEFERIRTEGEESQKWLAQWSLYTNSDLAKQVFEVIGWQYIAYKQLGEAMTCWNPQSIAGLDALTKAGRLREHIFSTPETFAAHFNDALSLFSESKSFEHIDLGSVPRQSENARDILFAQLPMQSVEGDNNEHQVSLLQIFLKRVCSVILNEILVTYCASEC